MAITVKVAEAKAHLSDLLYKVEAGEEVVISRGREPIAKLIRIAKPHDHAALMAKVRAAREGREPTTVAEILAWRDEGRR